MSNTSTQATSPAPPGRRRWLRWLLYTFAAAALILLLASFIVPPIAAGRVKAAIVEQIETDLGCEASIESLSLSLWSSRKATLTGLVIQNPPGFGGDLFPFVNISNATVDVSLWGALAGNPDVHLAAGADVYIVRSKDGRFNFDVIRQNQAATQRDKTPSAGQRPSQNEPADPLVRSLHLLAEIEPIYLMVVNLGGEENNTLTSRGNSARIKLHADLETLDGAFEEITVRLPGLSVDGAGQFANALDPKTARVKDLNLEVKVSKLWAGLLAPLDIEPPFQGTATLKLATGTGWQSEIKTSLSVAADKMIVSHPKDKDPVVLTDVTFEHEGSFNMAEGRFDLGETSLKLPDALLTARGSVSGLYDAPRFDIELGSTSDDPVKVMTAAADVTLLSEDNALRIDNAEIHSSFLNAQASGTIEQLDRQPPLPKLTATVDSDLARLNAVVLAPFGFLPKGLDIEGILHSELTSAGAAESLSSRGDTTITQFALHDRKAGRTVSDPVVRVTHEFDMPVKDGRVQKIIVRDLGVVSSLISLKEVSGSVADIGTTAAAIKDLGGRFGADFDKLGGLLGSLGVLHKGTTMKGSGSGTISIDGPVRSPELKATVDLVDFVLSFEHLDKPIREPKARVDLRVAARLSGTLLDQLDGRSPETPAGAIEAPQGAVEVGAIEIDRADLVASAGTVAVKGELSESAFDLFVSSDVDLARAAEHYGGFVPLPEDMKFAGHIRNRVTLDGPRSGLKVGGRCSFESVQAEGGPVGARRSFDDIIIDLDGIVDLDKGAIALGRADEEGFPGISVKSGLIEAIVLGTVSNFRREPRLDVSLDVTSKDLGQLATLAKSIMGESLKGLDMANSAGFSLSVIGSPTDPIVKSLTIEATDAAITYGDRFAKPSGSAASASFTSAGLNVNSLLKHFYSDAAREGALAPPDATASFRAVLGEVTFEQMSCSEAIISGELKDSICTITELALKPLGGTLTAPAGTTAMDLSTGRPFSRAQLEGRGVMLNPQVTDYLRFKMPIIPIPIGELSGQAALDLKEFTFIGVGMEDLLDTLNASGTITSPEITVKFGWLAQLLMGEKMLGKGPAEMTYDFVFRNRVIEATMAVKWAEAELTLKGTTTLPARTFSREAPKGRTDINASRIDYDVAAKYKGEIPHDLRKVVDENGALPIKLTGTLDDVKAKLNVPDLLLNILRDKLKDKDKPEEDPEDEPDKKRKPEDILKDILRNL